MPDPRNGVFETLLLLDGRPIEWESHIARLHASLAVLYPDLAAPEISPAGPLLGDALRIDVAPAGGRLRARVSTRQIDRRAAPALRSLMLPGGLGVHKWADRSLLEGVQAKLPDNALPLIVDDEEVLEASRANVFAVREGALVTPPLDGRILPGVTRMRVLELAAALDIETHEITVFREDLLAADEVFLTGSVRGVEPAGSLDGAPLAGAGEIADRLAAALRRAWTGAKTAAAFG